MLDLGWQEFFLIATIAVVVVGPKDLPKVIRTVVGWIRKVRSMARDFQGSIEEVAREAELDEVRQEALKLTKQDMSKTILDTVDPDRDLANALKETRSSVETDQTAENSMLDPAAAAAIAAIADPETEVTPTEDDAVKGWDAATVATPSNSIMAAPATVVEKKPTKKPRAKKVEAPGKAARKPAASRKVAKKPETGAADKPAPARKPRKPRAAPKATVETPTDTPVTEA